MNRMQRKLDFMDWELGVFFHFGIRTFYEGHVDWDMRPMSPEAFLPEELNCEQWIEVAHRAGAKYAILVCKHHDGFANWPSKYTDYSVAATPWREGQGDVVKAFTDACRKYGLKVGLYYSPAQFGSVTMDSKAYDDYFIHQIGELLTGYGTIDYLWFDGCGSEEHTYDTTRIIQEIRRMQPEILIFNMWDPDTRWICNEAGIAGMNETLEVSSLGFSVQTEREDLLEETLFLPGECDCKIRQNWFYSDADADSLKSLDELWGMYLNSVGHGANLLLNIAPDRRGLLPEADVARLLELGEKIRKEFSRPLVTFEDFEQEGDVFHAVFPKREVMKYVVLEEDLTAGSSVTDFDIEIAPVEHGPNKLVFRGCSIGHKMICPMTYLSAREVTVRIRGAKKEYRLKKITVY